MGPTNLLEDVVEEGVIGIVVHGGQRPGMTGSEARGGPRKRALLRRGVCGPRLSPFKLWLVYEGLAGLDRRTG